jgi:hypothetical protein
MGYAELAEQGRELFLGAGAAPTRRSRFAADFMNAPLSVQEDRRCFHARF